MSSGLRLAPPLAAVFLPETRTFCVELNKARHFSACPKQDFYLSSSLGQLISRQRCKLLHCRPASRALLHGLLGSVGDYG